MLVFRVEEKPSRKGNNEENDRHLYDSYQLGICHSLTTLSVARPSNRPTAALCWSVRILHCEVDASNSINNMGDGLRRASWTQHLHEMLYLHWLAKVC